MNENEEIEEKKEATVIPVEPEVSSFKLIFSLGLAGLISGIIIVGSYLYTLPIIEKNKAEAQRTAIFKVLEGCTSFVTLHLIDGKLVEDDNFPKVKKEAITKEEHEVFAGCFNTTLGRSARRNDVRHIADERSNSIDKSICKN